MSKTTTQPKQDGKKLGGRIYESVLEVVLIVTIVPALIVGVTALQDLPIV